MAEMYMIKSKAEYIQDVATGIMAGVIVKEVPQHIINEVYNQLCEIAYTLDEYHDWGQDDD